MIIDELEEEEHLEHYGILRRSGRYPWGSGGPENVSRSPNKRNKQFLDHIADLRKQGLTDNEIAKGMDISMTELRDARTYARAQQKISRVNQALKLHDKGWSNGAIAKKMGLAGESSVRALLAPGAKDKEENLMAIANMLKFEVADKRYVDVGGGVEAHLGVSEEKLRAATGMLRQEGYEVHSVKVPQVGTGLDTEHKVLVPPGVNQNEAWNNRFNIKQISAVTDDDGRTWDNKNDFPLVSIDPKRVAIRYGDEGGSEQDGMIYLRPGMEDLSLGLKRYSQVRIKVGDGHYLKGMAMYRDDLPPGTDILFNTAKNSTGNKLDAMKKLSDDKDYPFEGSITRPLIETIDGPDGPVKVVKSAMNIVNEEGQWNKWSRNISAQALSKQAPSLAKEQLNRTFEARKATFEEIMSLNNPVVKKKLLESFADDTDASAVHLKAAALDRQNWHVILPIESMKPGEIFAPRYNDGERVVLIRYPHGGTFEIPELVVNNKQREARKLIGTETIDAVGIHHTVAERLSGADFDGDTVLVIPNNDKKITVTPALEQLKGFDPKRLYKLPEGQKFSGNKQQLMGSVSNLITDMTILGAPHEEIVRAIKHSMVVIDAEKHDLDHRQSAIDNGIPALKAKYQGGANRGASTIISRAGSKVVLPDRKPRPYGEGGPIDLETGRKMFVDSGKSRLVNKETGERRLLTINSKKLAETDDAHTLVSDANTPVERLYAEHSNRLKALANKARLEFLNTPNMHRSVSAAKAYAKEVESLNAKLALSERKRPLERQAQIIANTIVRATKADNPGLTKDQMKKVRFQAQEMARARMGTKKKENVIDITPSEWNAIQAGAISHSKLKDIINNADLEQVQKYATPRHKRLMTRAKTKRAQDMLDRGFTRAQVAQALGVSVSTLDAATIGDAEDGDA